MTTTALSLIPLAARVKGLSGDVTIGRLADGERRGICASMVVQMRPFVVAVIAFGASLLAGCGERTLIVDEVPPLAPMPEPAGTTCPEEGTHEATLTGVVRAPTPEDFGPADPLAGAIVYVPGAAVQPFEEGVACDVCGSPVSGTPRAMAVSGPDGSFSLRCVPAGDDVPLVIQMGRWRRQVKIPRVPARVTTAVPSELTRLPRHKGEGDIPRIAIVTGQFDSFDCLLRKIGIADSEFTAPSEDGRVHLYDGGGNTLARGTPAASTLTSSLATLRRYDMVLLPCNNPRPTEPAVSNLVSYTSAGGRLFLTDNSWDWLRSFGTISNEAWDPFRGGSPSLTLLPAGVFTAEVDRTFPQGAAFAAWLVQVNPASPVGTLPFHDPWVGMGSYGTAVRAPTVVSGVQRWLYTDKPVRAVHQLSFDTPRAAPPSQRCGRVVYHNPHLAELTMVGRFPATCGSAPMTPQEKTLEFMLFDMSSCLR